MPPCRAHNQFSLKLVTWVREPSAFLKCIVTFKMEVISSHVAGLGQSELAIDWMSRVPFPGRDQYLRSQNTVRNGGTATNG